MNPAEKPTPPQEASLESVMLRLESIVAGLERGDLPLEQALQVFEEGVGLVKHGQSRLEDMERRIEQLLSNGKVAPLSEGVGKGSAPQRGTG